MENKLNIKKDYLFEVIERISRFYIHLEEIQSQFYFNNDNKVKDKLIFIQSYKDCLVKHFEICIYLLKEIKKESDGSDVSLDILKSVIININHLHKDYLSHLPRPSEPIELKRFGRIIDKHVVNLKKVIQSKASNQLNDSYISIYLSEEIGESTFVKDPIFEYKEKELKLLINNFNTKKIANTVDNISENKDISKIHISIPRIDANNPCRWPTLMHEVGHHLIKNDFFNDRPIEEDFKLSLDNIQLQFISTLEVDINIHSWLIECWCDLFACLVMGPAFWFSQFASFIFQEKNDLNTVDNAYPKALFRLKLIQKILIHRFPNSLLNELNASINSSENILNYFDLLD